jgi:AcrR family transcriptional regulator
MTTKTPKRTKRSVQREAEESGAEARRRQIIYEASRLFSSRGFEATTIRDIASAAGILGGSIYYHFQSKEEIFLAVHSAGMEAITSAVVAAIAQHQDPWAQLEAAAVAHSTALLSSSELPVIVSFYHSKSLDPLREQLVAQRDQYDRVIADVVDRLDLAAGIDRNIFRLHFLGALNWMPTWYRPEAGMSAAEIGRHLVAMLRH